MEEKGKKTQTPETNRSREYRWGIPTQSSVKDGEYQKLLSLDRATQHLFQAVSLLSDGEVEIPRAKTVLPRAKAAIKTLKGDIQKYIPFLVTSEKYDIDIPFLQWNVRRVKDSLYEGRQMYRYEWKPFDIFSSYLTTMEEMIAFAEPGEERVTLSLDGQEEGMSQILFHSYDWRKYKEKFNRLEDDPNTEAGRLKREHERRAKRSDLFVDWEEEYLVLQEQDEDEGSGGWYHLEHFQQEHFRELLSLCHRIPVRDELLKRLTRKGKIRINGVIVTRKNGRLHATEDFPQVMVDLLGEEVVIGKTKTRYPPARIVEEKKLVEAYQQTPLVDLVVLPEGFDQILKQQQEEGLLPKKWWGTRIQYVSTETAHRMLSRYSKTGIDATENLLGMLLQYLHPQAKKTATRYSASYFEFAVAEEVYGQSSTVVVTF